jgi:hypothetical protein
MQIAVAEAHQLTTHADSFAPSREHQPRTHERGADVGGLLTRGRQIMR